MSREDIDKKQKFVVLYHFIILKLQGLFLIFAAIALVAIVIFFGFISEPQNNKPPLIVRIVLSIPFIFGGGGILLYYGFRAIFTKYSKIKMKITKEYSKTVILNRTGLIDNEE